MMKTTEKDTVSVRINKQFKELLAEWAEKDGVSIGVLVERILSQEAERRYCGISLDTLDEKISRIQELLLSRKTKKRADKQSPRDMDIPNFLNRTTWVAWLNHLRALGQPVNIYVASKYLTMLEDIDNKGWDCNMLLQFLINNNHRTIFIPGSWIHKSK